jgi:hypothetical protein
MKYLISLFFISLLLLATLVDNTSSQQVTTPDAGLGTSAGSSSETVEFEANDSASQDSNDQSSSSDQQDANGQSGSSEQQG